jgi:hypothetical protein
MNHMRAINAINKCGSLSAAVEGGVLRDGILYHCVKAGVPYVLAGSIRDDGPLPDTIMDLIAAQARTAEQIVGADMELILSTMLHGIGVGNMTPVVGQDRVRRHQSGGGHEAGRSRFGPGSGHRDRRRPLPAFTGRCARSTLKACAGTSRATVCARSRWRPWRSPPTVRRLHDLPSNPKSRRASRCTRARPFSRCSLSSMQRAYDEENRPAMHPVRLHVRQALEALVPPALRSECQAYYAAHDSTATPWTYAVVAMSTSGPPDFEFGREWTNDVGKQAEFVALSELPVAAGSVLRRRADRFAVRDGFAPSTSTTSKQYERIIRHEVETAVAYCRVRDVRELAGGGETPHAVVIPNLLESNERAFSFVLADTFYAVEGPQPVLGYNPHEFIHAIMNPMSYDPAHAPAQARAESLFVVAREVTGGADEAHASLAAWMDEELVRAIALRYGVGDDATRLGARRGGDAAGMAPRPSARAFFGSSSSASTRRVVVHCAKNIRICSRASMRRAELQRWRQDGALPKP